MHTSAALPNQICIVSALNASLEAVFNLQPCQQQDQEHQLQAGRSWDSSGQLNCVAPLDGSGDFLIESLFPEFYDFNDSSIWGGEMAGTHVSDLVSTGIGDLSGFQPSLHNNGGCNIEPYNFDGVNSGGLSGGTNTSPVSSGLMPSTLPTPASVSTSEQRPTKKRQAPEDGARTTSPQSESSSYSTDKVVKRQRNTEAARRYRQRKVDRVTELEEALAAMTKDRDDFRLKLARSEAEVEVLRRLVGKGT